MICPRCKGDGYEDSPPLRKCWTCHGTGHVPDPPPVKGVGPDKKSRSAPAAKDKKHGKK
jgi:RecJ-like exonuclease